MRSIDADALMPLFIKKANTMEDRHGVKAGEDWLLNYNDIKDVIDNAPTIKPKVVVIEPKIIEKLADSVVDVIGKIDWDKAIEAYKERPTGDRPNWVPIKYRPLTEEERIHFSEYWGVEYCDTLSEKAFDCPMPEHKQEILLTTNWGVKEDVCLYDPDEGYSLEENGDWDGVIAWMPKPEPYKEADNG